MNKIIVGFLALFFVGNEQLLAEIIPDNSLPNSTKVEINGETTLIQEGTIKNTNLFHSFEEFSFKKGEVLFLHDDSINNIFSRVTGSKISEINGLISVAGDANLFLMNPNGIIFGRNASLNLNGSFYATTANWIEFKDGYRFAANPKTQEPLLTISSPIGLGLVNNQGTIKVLGNPYAIQGNIDLTENYIATLQSPPILDLNQIQPTLEVNPGQIISLSGNAIEFIAGTISGGDISIIASNTETIELNESNKIFVPTTNNNVQSGLIKLDNASVIKSIIPNSSNITNSNITLSASSIDIADGSLVISRNESVEGTGNIYVEAQKLNISGFNFIPSTQSIIQSEIASDSTVEYSPAANIYVKANDIQFSNLGLIGTANHFSFGTSGDIKIEADRLRLIDGGTIATRTTDGYAGDIDISSETIYIGGNNQVLPNVISSIISAITGNSTLGKTGLIKIESEELKIYDGASVSNISFGFGTPNPINVNTNLLEIQGRNEVLFSGIFISNINFLDSSDITIKAEQINLLKDAFISAGSIGEGQSGSIFIEATNLNIDGGGIVSTNFNINTISFLRDLPEYAVARQVPVFPSTGKGGNIFIDSETISLANDALIGAGSYEFNDAGSIFINSDSIILNRSQISATTDEGSGGNINITTNLLQAYDNSQITALAGGQGNGGNVNINTNIALFNNSQVIAAAEAGNGGRINVTTQSLFTKNALFDASSQFSTDGTINLDIELSEAELAFELPSFDLQEVAIAPCQPKVGSNFEIQGQSTPIQGLQQDYSVAKPQIAPLQEATAMEIKPDGQIFLTRPAPVNHNVAMACDRQ